MHQIYRRTAMPRCDFNKVALQLYWNYTSAWVFSCKFVFSEHLFLRTALDGCFCYYQQTNHITFGNSLFKSFSISVTSLWWQKIRLSSSYKDVWVFDRACEILFMYCKNNKDPNIDPWGTPEFMITSSQKIVLYKTKKAVLVR